MASQISLRSTDVAVALRLAEAPSRTYAELGEDLGISASTAHEAVDRLKTAGLVRSEGRNGARNVNPQALLEFLEHGIRYSWPALLEGRALGVPTAHSGPELASEIDQGEEPIVWPSNKGSVRGRVLIPLYNQAVELPSRCPSIYRILTLVDALRVGRNRERKIAIEKLKNWLANIKYTAVL